MTTDIVAKAVSRQVTIDGVTITITGIAKGSGMIHPNMATMLGYIATDAAIAQPLLQQMVREAANRSFNCITVDGDTSTNDALMLIATGSGRQCKIADAIAAAAALCNAITEVATQLAQAIVRDGEGATKFITVQVEGGTTRRNARRSATRSRIRRWSRPRSSPPIPTSAASSAAVGYAGIADLDVDAIELYLDDVLVAERRAPPRYREEDGQRVMQQSDITVRVELNRGAAQTTVWTCDFSYDYVKINADYRS